MRHYYRDFGNFGILLEHYSVLIVFVVRLQLNSGIDSLLNLVFVIVLEIMPDLVVRALLNLEDLLLW